jgi:transposase-like protein
MSLVQLLHKVGVEKDPNFVREAIKLLAEAVMELEVSIKTGAERYERSTERKVYRNGYRARRWDTQAGTVDLLVPKVREGSFFPSILEPRRRADQALHAVIQEAYVAGVSTRKVDALIKSLGIEGVSKSEVSRICEALDEHVAVFRNRTLTGAYPYVWLDATYVKVRQQGRVLSMAVVVAVGVREDGNREILGFDLGPAEDATFWLGFLRSLVARGLYGVQLVVSDAHEGLRKAIPAVFGGAVWQRCRVHFLRNVLSHVPKTHQDVVAVVVRSIFMQPDIDEARAQLRRAIESFEDKYPKVARLLDEAGEDVLAHLNFPTEHRRQLHSTNTLERLNKEIKRRTNVVGIFPNEQAVLRLVGALLAEQQDEWAVGKRYFSLESMAKLIARSQQAVSDPPLLTQG